MQPDLFGCGRYDGLSRSAEISECGRYRYSLCRTWCMGGDGRSACFVMLNPSIADAESVIDALPLSKANLVDHEYTEMGPLAPLSNLIAPNAPR